MKHLALPLLAALTLLAWRPAAAAPEGAASASVAASAPQRARPRVKLPPHPLSQTEQHKVDGPPLDKPPQGEVKPQISIPLGRKARPQDNTQAPGARSNGRPANVIDDAAARCNAQPDEAARAACREKAARGR